MDPAEPIIPDDEYNDRIRKQHLRRAEQEVPLLNPADAEIRAKMMLVADRTNLSLNTSMLGGNFKGRKNKEYIAQAILNCVRIELAANEPTSST